MPETNPAPADSSLKMLGALGQSVWLDFIGRDFLTSGALARLVEQDGVSGVTSNPAIFEQAIAEGSAYDQQLREEWARPGATAQGVYDALIAADVTKAADILLPLYRRRGGCDGYVSVEVSPEVAGDTAGTIAEAKRWWRRIDRPNLMVKVPATTAGVAAIRLLIEDGINVNATLLFAVDRYAEVLEAYISGIENRANRGLPVGEVAGVASFFVSRIDVAADREIDARIAAGDAQADALRTLKGKLAIASAAAAYHSWRAATKGVRWRILADKGALPHRLLWASTGAKNPAYSDVLYVDRLIGRDTISTMPPKTLDAFRDHGTVAPTLDSAGEEARSVLRAAADLGISLDAITAGLLRAGVEQFAEAAARSVRAIAGRRTAAQVLEGALDGRTGL
jgi:transaldolase/glucose-6-phosphate isomerase